MKHVDIVVVGAGVAGSIFAANTDKELQVVVIDKKDHSNVNKGFKKPCGGLLSVDAQRSLARLNLTLPLYVLANPQIFAVETIDEHYKFSRLYQRSYINIHRHRFDHWLASLIPNHVDVIDNAFVQRIDQQNDYYVVTYAKNKITHRIACTSIVGADGASSIVRRFISTKPIHQYLAIQEHVFKKTQKAQYTCYFNKHLTTSYGWSSNKDDSFIYGVALPLNNAHESFNQFKDMVIKYHPLEAQAHLKEACLVNCPTSLHQLELGKNNILLIGEAAGWISPSSLEGISYAIDSALIATYCVNQDGVQHKKYRSKSMHLKVKIFLKILKAHVLYNPYLRQLIMRSKIQTITLFKK